MFRASAFDWKSKPGKLYRLMFRTLIIITFLSQFLTQPALAQDEVEDILRCKILDADKYLSVQLEGQNLIYRFSRSDELELELNAAAIDAYTPWPGVGRNYYEAVTFENSGYIYEVYYTVDRLDLEKPAEAGLIVSKEDEVLTHLICDQNSLLIQQLTELSGMLADRGLCWSYDTHEWQICEG